MVIIKMTGFQPCYFRVILFNDSYDLSLKGSWICSLVRNETSDVLGEQSSHVETVVLLSKLKSAKSIEVKIELDEMDLTIAESKATYDKIKQYVLDKTGLKVSQLYIAQVKRKHGLIERINYNVGDGKAKVPQVPLEKEEAIEDALRHFKMI